MSVIFTNDVVLGEAEVGGFPLSHARILYDSVLRRQGQLIATPGLPGFPEQAALNPLTYEAWRPESMPANWRYDWSLSQKINAVGIASHNLASLGTEVVLEVNADGGWQELAAVVPSDNGPILFLFPHVTTSGLRITLRGDNAPLVGVIYAGMTLEMARPIYGGHSPADLSRKTVIVGSRSEGGQALSWQVQREGTRTSYDWKHLTADWYRERFDPFVEYATRGGGYFFIAWRPGKFPDEVQYGAVSGDISPSNMGTRDYMQVKMTVNGLGPTGRSY